MNKTLENILKGTVLTGFAMSTFLPIDSPMLGNGQYLNAQEKQETQTTQASQDAKKKEEQKKQKDEDDDQADSPAKLGLSSWQVMRCR